MITEEMVAAAKTGKTVYFVSPEGLCMMLWWRSDRLQISPARDDDCPNG